MTTAWKDEAPSHRKRLERLTDSRLRDVLLRLASMPTGQIDPSSGLPAEDETRHVTAELARRSALAALHR